MHDLPDVGLGGGEVCMTYLTLVMVEGKYACLTCRWPWWRGSKHVLPDVAHGGGEVCMTCLTLVMVEGKYA